MEPLLEHPDNSLLITLIPIKSEEMELEDSFLELPQLLFNTDQLHHSPLLLPHFSQLQLSQPHCATQQTV